MTEPLDPPTTAQPLTGQRCKAKSSRTGQPCKLRPVKGSTVCRVHGGAAPQVRRAAEARLLEAKARTLFGKQYDNSPVLNPLAAYAEFAGEVQGMRAVMLQLVADLQTPEYRNALGDERARAVLELYGQYLDRTNAVFGTYARLNIDARLVAIEQAKVEMLTGALNATLAWLGLPRARAIEAARFFASKLRVLEGEVKDR